MHTTVDGMTAVELAAHLSELVDDEAFVLKAVRLKFPQYGEAGCSHPGPRKRLTDREARKSINASKANYRERNYVKPCKDESIPSYDNAEGRRQHATAMAEASKALLYAIHKAHPAIMNTLAAQGRTVVYP